jgi:tRNA(fMet)-specific endonuclease VapC
MSRYVLDTNIISFLLRREPRVFARYLQANTPDNVLYGCPIVYYEVRRGLLTRDARKQMVGFEKLFTSFNWQDYSRRDWMLAAALWARRTTGGRPVDDADLMIAVFARNRNAVLVTDNVKDFDGLDVTLENWKS